MSLSPEEIRRSFESFEKRNKNNKFNRSDILRNAAIFDKRIRVLKYLSILGVILGIIYFIISGSDNTEAYVLSCQSTEKKYQKAYYSKYSFVDDEWDSWNELITDIYITKTLNGELSYSDNETSYKNTFGYYSSDAPIIENMDFKEEDGFDKYQKENDTDILITFEDGRSYNIRKRNDYNQCMKYYSSEQPLNINTFYGDITGINF